MQISANFLLVVMSLLWYNSGHQKKGIYLAYRIVVEGVLTP